MIKSFDELNITQLRSLVRKYNLHTKIVQYTKLDKPKLITEMSKHMHINNEGRIYVRTSAQQNIALQQLLGTIHEKIEKIKKRIVKKKPAPAQPPPPPPQYETTSEEESSEDEIVKRPLTASERKELQRRLQIRRNESSSEENSDASSSEEEKSDMESEDERHKDEPVPRMHYEGTKKRGYFIPEAVEKYNHNIDIILKDLPNDKKKKAYLVNNDPQIKSKYSKIPDAIRALYDYFKFQNPRAYINALEGLQSDEDYHGFVFYKDGNELVMTAAADIMIREHLIAGEDEDKEIEVLHINLLQGVGGAGMILDLIKNIAEGKVKEAGLKIPKYDFMDLQALPSGNTLDFYDYKGGRIDDPHIERYRAQVIRAIGEFKPRTLQKYRKIKAMPHKSPEERVLKTKKIYKFWDKNIRGRIYMMPYMFFYDTKASQEDKKLLSDDWHRAQPKETLEEEINA